VLPHSPHLLWCRLAGCLLSHCVLLHHKYIIIIYTLCLFPLPHSDSPLCSATYSHNSLQLMNSVAFFDVFSIASRVQISCFFNAERVAAGRVRAIAWLKDAVDDYRHWEKMHGQTEASLQQQQQNLDQKHRQPTEMHHEQPDAPLTPSSSSLPYPLTPRKLETLKAVSVENSSVGVGDASSSNIGSMHPPPPHSLSRINDAEVSNLINPPS
jgi:hypothetical protein